MVVGAGESIVAPRLDTMTYADTLIVTVFCAV
jgi:hypothetical protein